jgi:hypothetical protein
MNEKPHTHDFEERVFVDHRQDKFWCMMSPTTKDGKLVSIDTLWNYPPVRDLTEWTEYMAFASAAYASMFNDFGRDAVLSVPVYSDAVSFDNVNEEVTRKFKEKRRQNCD